MSDVTGVGSQPPPGPPEEVVDRGHAIAGLSNEEFDRLVEQVDRSAATPAASSPDGDAWFERLVGEALDELPDVARRSLRDNVAVCVSDDGAEHRAYGRYEGGTVVHGIFRHTILIFRDTLVRDFGHDPDELRRQVTITVRHELAHHLGASERRVEELGL